jgi:DNA-binding LacI/PurR family transcriptional regulator
MKNSQATIRDLALKLNIAISTVSRALRNAPDINPETKKAVLDLARKMNYEPNRIAQSLRMKRTNTLGIVVPQINLHFFSSAISGIQEYASDHNYGVMICQSLESLKTEISTVQMLVANRVDGLLISLSKETDNLDHIHVLMGKKIPVVLFDRVADELDVTKVIVDDYDGAYKAVEHLIKTGCKNIAYIGGQDYLYISSKRLNGYKDALAHYNVPLRDDLIVHCTDFVKDPVEAARHLLQSDKKPDAFFCMNDPIAVLLIQVLKEWNIKIPEEVSIIGFTNEPSSQLIEPSLTTVAQPSHEMGQVAAELFLQQIEFKDQFTPVTKILPTELVIRNSTRKTITAN